MSPIIIPIRRGLCPVCTPSQNPGTVRVELVTLNPITRRALPSRTVPCPVCNGGDVEWVVYMLQAMARAQDIERVERAGRALDDEGDVG